MYHAETNSAQSKPKRSEPRFPDVIFFRGRGFMPRSALNRYKAEIQAFALGVTPVELPPIDPDPFVPLKQVCVELGVGRRTIGRRISEAAAFSAGADASEPA